MSRSFLILLCASFCVSTPNAEVQAQQPDAWLSRFTARHVLNEGVGRDEGFTSLEWFLPLNQDAELEMGFGDFRGLMFDDAEFGGNLGLGYRWYNSDTDRIFGVNAYWDFRHESSLLFNQVGIGLESLGPIVDLRVNGYTPTVHDASQPLPIVLFGGNNLINLQYSALSGVDYEAAVNLPNMGPVRTRVAGGGYFFDSSDTEAAIGWRARLEVFYKDSVAASVAVQEDDVFGQTVNIGIELRRRIEHTGSLSRRTMRQKFRDENGGGDGATVLHRLADPVYRQQNIVLKQTRAAVTDGSGDVLSFLHVVEGAVAGDGTFEMPFGSISAAAADPLAPFSVIFTPEGGTFTENVTLVDGTRLLSNGPVQTLETSAGSFQLPFSGAGSDLAALPASIVGDVTLASNTEFSGFDVTGGVSGAGIVTTNINQVAINMAPADALSFTGSDGINVDRVAISMPAGRGIFLNDSAATISNVTIADAGDDGIQIDSDTTDRLVDLSNVVTTNAGNEGIDVNVAGSGDLTLNVVGGSTEAANNAFDIATTLTGNAIVNVDDSALVSSGGNGFNLNVLSAGDLTLDVTEGSVNSSGDAVNIATSSTGSALVNLNDLTMTSTAAGGIVGVVGGTGNLTLGVMGGEVESINSAFDLSTISTGNAFVSVDQLVVASTSGAGFIADGSAGTGTLFINGFSNNIVTEAAAGGVLFDTVVFDSDVNAIGNQPLSSNALTVGTTLERIFGAGVSVTNATGEWDAGVLSIFNTAGTGLLVDNSGVGTPIVLSSQAGSVIDTTMGSALQLDTVTSGLLFNSITTVGSPTVGIGITSVAGTVTSTTTTSTTSALASVRYEDIPAARPLTTDFGTTLFDSTTDRIGDTTGLTEN